MEPIQKETKFYLDDVADEICMLAEDRLPNDDERSLYRMYAMLANQGGMAITDEAVHDCWSLWTVDKYPGHPSLVPFHELLEDVQELDRKYRYAIEIVAARLTYEYDVSHWCEMLDEYKGVGTR